MENLPHFISKSSFEYCDRLVARVKGMLSAGLPVFLGSHVPSAVARRKVVSLTTAPVAGFLSVTFESGPRGFVYPHELQDEAGNEITASREP